MGDFLGEMATLFFKNDVMVFEMLHIACVFEIARVLLQ